MACKICMFPITSSVKIKLKLALVLILDFYNLVKCWESWNLTEIDREVWFLYHLGDSYRCVLSKYSYNM